MNKTAMSCTYCKNILTTKDEIFGTSSGLLYHFLCLPDSRNKSVIYPYCDFYNPLTFKIFLESCESFISSESQNRTLAIHSELEASKGTICFLTEKCKNSQLSVRSLEDKLKILNDALIKRNATVSYLEDRIAELNNTIYTELNKSDGKSCIDPNCLDMARLGDHRNDHQCTAYIKEKSSVEIIYGKPSTCTDENLDLNIISIQCAKSENSNENYEVETTLNETQIPTDSGEVKSHENIGKKFRNSSLKIWASLWHYVFSLILTLKNNLNETSE